MYGASARGLAIDVGLPSPEEFPRFIKFWLERPKPDAKQARVWALADSPAMSGAYQFLITPGNELAIDVCLPDDECAALARASRGRADLPGGLIGLVRLEIEAFEGVVATVDI